jgi:hypothetical protein
MTEALLLVVVGSLVPVSVATLVIAVLTLRKAHSYVAMVEQRLESFHEGQLLLLALLREQNRRPVEQSSAEERSPEERASEGEQAEDLVRLERDRLELAVHSRRHAGRGSDETAPRDRPPPPARERRDAAQRDPAATEKPRKEETRGTETRPRAANFPDTASSRPPKPPPDDESPPRAVWHPHPDDDVSPARTGEPGDAAVEMFRRHYDKYLENYEGYVKLAARLYRMREDAEVPPGSAAEREWDGRLRRVTDGIQRTTARLDILEEYNPELATDDRISRRAAIARSQRVLETQGRHR